MRRSQGPECMRLTLALMSVLVAAIMVTVMSVHAGEARVPDRGLKDLGRGVEQVKLKDVEGKTVRLKDFGGKPYVLFFGFTRCPVVCPVTVWELDAALEAIGKDAKDIAIVFITLDPGRDTPAVMKNYFSGFKGRVTALTAPLPVITRMTKAYDVRFERVDTGKGDYSIDHTAHAFLVNARGGVVDTVAFGASRELSVARLKSLIEADKRRN